MTSPSTPGSLPFHTLVYAAAGLSYPPALHEYASFETPAAGFATRRIDISDFAELGAGAFWPFDNASVPINGIVCVPEGAGPFPLALFVHGNHRPIENSTPGYRYLCELLASHGIVAAMIDSNFLNGGNFGENDARAIVVLEHARQFQKWHQQQGHPLHGKIDLGRVLLGGHSRGGEGVGHASAINRLASIQPEFGGPIVPLDGSAGLGPYGFGVRGVVAIAPTDQQHVPMTGPTRVPDRYLIMHGSRDGDVSDFQGYHTYDRAHAVDLGNPAVLAENDKALLWIHRANHNHFNSVWRDEWGGGTSLISRADQEQIAKVYIAALARAELLGETDYRQLFVDHQIALVQGWLPAGASIVTQFHDRNRLWIQHFEEGVATPVVSAPVQGSVTHHGIGLQELHFSLGADSHLFQDTRGLRIEWQGQGGYVVDIDPESFQTNGFSAVALRIGQSAESLNPPGALQEFSLRFEDGAQSATILSSTLAPLLYPDSADEGSPRKTVMQTLRVSFERLRTAGVDPQAIRRITLQFGLQPTGILYFDDLQFTA